MQHTYPNRYNETNIEEAAAQIAQLASSIRIRRAPPNIGTFAACKFCGQLISVAQDDLKDLESVEGAIYYATTRCTCPQAKHHLELEQMRERRERARQYDLMEAQAAIEDQFGADTECGGGISEKVRQMLLEIATMVYDHRIKATTVTVNNHTKAVIATSNKGKLMIDRKESDTSRVEIG